MRDGFIFTGLIRHVKFRLSMIFMQWIISAEKEKNTDLKRYCERDDASLGCEGTNLGD